MFEMMKIMYTTYKMPEIQYLSDTSHFITQGEIQIQIYTMLLAHSSGIIVFLSFVYMTCDSVTYQEC